MKRKRTRRLNFNNAKVISHWWELKNFVPGGINGNHPCANVLILFIVSSDTKTAMNNQNINHRVFQAWNMSVSKIFEVKIEKILLEWNNNLLGTINWTQTFWKWEKRIHKHAFHFIPKFHSEIFLWWLGVNDCRVIIDLRMRIINDSSAHKMLFLCSTYDAATLNHQLYWNKNFKRTFLFHCYFIMRWFPNKVENLKRYSCPSIFCKIFFQVMKGRHPTPWKKSAEFEV